MYAAITLGFGVVVGTALDPGLTGLGAVGPQIIQLPGQEAPSTDSGITADSGSGDAAAPSPAAPSAPSYGSAYSSGSYGGGGGGGGGGNPKPKPKYLTGTVAQANPYAESYALAIGNGPLTSVHATKAPEVGSKVKVKVVELSNGTYAQAAKPELKRHPASQKTASARVEEESIGFSGTVSYRDTLRGLYTVSSAGVSALVHAPDGFLISDIPQVGDLVQVQAKIEDLSQASGSGRGIEPTVRNSTREVTGCNPEASYPLEAVDPETRLVEQSHSVTLTGLTNYSITGIVQRTCEDDGQLIVSADDLNATGEDISLHPPDDFDVGSKVTNPEWDGTRQGGHGHRGRKDRLRPQLARDLSDVVRAPLEVDVFAGEREKALELRLTFQVALRPIVDALTADQDVGTARGIP